MPTKPLESILWREFSKKEMKEVISIASPLLIEVVNYGTNLLARCHDSSKAEPDVDIALISLYHHMLEMTDGIQVLISQGCCFPAIPLVRSSFEALVSIKYILQTEEDYKKRSLSWNWGYLNNRIELFGRLLSSEEKGRKFQVALKKERGKEKKDNIEKEAQAEIDQINYFLRRDLYKEVIEEATKTKKKKWHNLFIGPSSLEDMAEKVDKLSEYLTLYCLWSEISHAKDFRSLTKTSGGITALERIRKTDQSDLAGVSSFAIKFMKEASELVLGKFKQGELITEWYAKEIQQGFERLKDLHYSGPEVFRKVH